MMQFVNTVAEIKMKPIADFLSFCEIHNIDDLERVSNFAEALSIRIENGENISVKLIDYILQQIEEYENSQILKMGIEQPDDVEMVKYFLELNDMTITALAEKIGMSRTVLSEILNRKNNRRFSKNQIGDLAKVFGVKVSVFY